MIQRIRSAFLFDQSVSCSDPIADLWVKYFTQETPRSLLLSRPNSRLSALYCQFTLQDVRPKDLLVPLRESEKDGTSRAKLPFLLQFDRPVPIHYISFASLLFTPDMDVSVARPIVSEVYRAARTR
jgi:hypothetical protein